MLGLMAVLPFLQYRHYYPLTDFYTEWLSFGLGLAALAALVWRLPRASLTSLAPLALIFLAWIQFAMGRIAQVEEVMLVSVYLLWGMLLMLLGKLLRQELGLSRVARGLAWFLLAGGILSSAAGLFQQYGTPLFLLPYITPNGSPTVYGNLAQRNHLADYLSLSLASVLFLASFSTEGEVAWRQGRSLFLGVSALLFLYVLALTGSRSAWLYLLALAALAFFHWRGNRNPQGVFLRNFAMMLLPVFLLAQWFAHLALLAAHGVAGATATERLITLASGSSIRLDIWKEGWLSFLDHPFFGCGFGQFAWQHFVYAGVSRNPDGVGLYTNTHNILMQFLAETGVAGTLIVVAAGVFWFRQARNSFAADAWWIYALLAVMGIHSLLEYPLWYSQFLGLFMFLLGLGENNGATVVVPRQGRAVVAVALLAGAVLLWSTMRDYSRYEGLLYPDYHGGGGAQSSLELYRSLSALRTHSLLAPNVEVPFAEMMALDSHELRAKLEINTRAAHFSPVGMTAYRQAVFLALNGEIDAAKLQLERAAIVSPELIEPFSSQLFNLAKTEPLKIAPLIERLNAIRLRQASGS